MIGRADIYVREYVKGEVRCYIGGGASYDQRGICAGLNLGDDCNLACFSNKPGGEENVGALPEEEVLDEERAVGERIMETLVSGKVKGNNGRELKSSYTCEHDGRYHPSAPCLGRRRKECPVEQAVRAEHDGNITPGVNERIDRARRLAGLKVED